ncbi:hypothetical protein C8Q80DRAFT_1115775 [Daedaleopsis nitida]|nr:hypothetical protein C8Q80DRAFT_1115775 [Daedaleopsis nitida]
MPVKVVSSLEEFKAIVACTHWRGPSCRVRLLGDVVRAMQAHLAYLEKLADQNSGADFYKVDVDEASDIAQEVGVRSIPTFMAFQNGNKIGKEVVSANPPGLQALIASVAPTESA